MRDDFRSFLLQLPKGLSGVETSKRCMRYLMQKQYKGNPPNPCPCA